MICNKKINKPNCIRLNNLRSYPILPSNDEVSHWCLWLKMHLFWKRKNVLQSFSTCDRFEILFCSSNSEDIEWNDNPRVFEAWLSRYVACLCHWEKWRYLILDVILWSRLSPFTVVHSTVGHSVSGFVPTFPNESDKSSASFDAVHVLLVVPKVKALSSPALLRVTLE